MRCGSFLPERLCTRVSSIKRMKFVIQVVFFALMMAAAEAGYRLGRRFEAGMPQNIKSQISTVEASILGVLALLLGFTISMAVTRFESRKQLVLEEADAIGTSLLRAQLLPAPAGPEIASLLRQYANIRVQYGNAGSDLDRLEELNRQTTRMQTELWARTSCVCATGSKSGHKRLAAAVTEPGYRHGRSALDGIPESCAGKRDLCECRRRFALSHAGRLFVRFERTPEYLFHVRAGSVDHARSCRNH